MTKRYSILTCGTFLIALALVGAGCSSSQTSDDEFGEEISSADAGTDAVPSLDAEMDASTGDAQSMEGQTAEAETPDPQATEAPVADGQTADGQLTTTESKAQPADPNAVPAPDQQVAATPPESTPAPVVEPQPEAVAPPVAAVIPTETESTPPSSTESSTVASDSSSSETESYKVRHGDTLMRIAFEHYGDLYKWKAIYEANKDKIKDPNVISAGTVLTLENVSKDLPERTGEKYLVKHGDTLVSISNEVYGTPHKWKKIWKHNKAWIPNPNKIFAGFYLYYSMGAQDQEERDNQQNTPTPLAQDQAPTETAQAPVDDRGPASVGVAK